MAVATTACAAGHGDVLHCTEMFKTRVAAHFVHRSVHDHVVLALDRKWQWDITLFQRLSLMTKKCSIDFVITKDKHLGGGGGGEALQLNAIFFLICSIHKKIKLRQMEDFIKIFLRL